MGILSRSSGQPCVLTLLVGDEHVLFVRVLKQDDTSGARRTKRSAPRNHKRGRLLDRGEHEQSREQAGIVHIDALYVSRRLHCQTKRKKDSLSQCLSLRPLSI
jgi:hypothetical protein